MSLAKDEIQTQEQPKAEPAIELVPAPDPVRKKRNMSKPTSGHVLSDNTNLLKAINVNKMNHQYIQNLQKANMTLKCKIKEMAEMGPGSQVSTIEAETAVTRGDGGRWFDLEAAEEEVELKELGTIEQISSERLAARKERQRRAEEGKERREKERAFYDRGRLGYRPRGQKQPAGIAAQAASAADRRVQQNKQPPVNRPRPVQPKPQSRPRVWAARGEEPYVPERAMPRQSVRYDEYADGYYEPPYWYEPRPYLHQPYGYGPPPVAPYYLTRGQRQPFKAHYLDRAYEMQAREQKVRQDMRNPPRYQKRAQKAERIPRQRKQPGVVRPAGESDDEAAPVEKLRTDARDMRPAAFIKDLRRRAEGLEEEKAQHRAQKKARVVSKLTEVGAKPSAAIRKMEERVAAAESTLASDDPKALGLLIYSHKMSEDSIDAAAQAESPQKMTQLNEKLEALIQEAETKLVEA